MDLREKLIELCNDLETLPCCDTYEGQADYLIENGVTVQEWIPVTERLPEDECLAISMLKGKLSYKECLVGLVYADEMCKTGFYCESNGEILFDVTHWRPLPEPPKGD